MRMAELRLAICGSRIIHRGWLLPFMRSLDKPLIKALVLVLYCALVRWNNHRSTGVGLFVLELKSRLLLCAIKSSPTLDYERRARSWSRFLGSQPVAKPGCRLSLLSARQRNARGQYQIILLGDSAHGCK